MNPIEHAMAEGRADAREGRPARDRPRGMRTKTRHHWYMTGYRVERSRMQRIREAAQLSLWAADREEARA